MYALISGTLWRDPVARQSKLGKRFATALLRAGTPQDAVWCNIVAFDETAQSELLRLAAGDALTAQGRFKIGVFEKAGEHRASLDLTATHVLPLRGRPTATRKPRERAPETAPEFEDAIPF